MDDPLTFRQVMILEDESWLSLLQVVSKFELV